MLFVSLLLLLALIIIGPQLWIRWVFFRYSSELPELPGNGAELARHLLNRFEIAGVTVEEAPPLRDHFDPTTPAIRLSSNNAQGRSLTAVAIAAHEVGHAIQWHRQETVFLLRKRYIPIARRLQQLGIAMISLSPILALVTRSPAGAALPLAGGVLAALCGAATYLIILPEEWDASFNKALPILTEGNYINDRQVFAVRRILRAAAFTYAAGALASILQFWRWLPLLLRR